MTASASGARFEFWIDRGGTFTDVVARRSDGVLVTAKLLSENPEHYRDAAVEGIRRILELGDGEPIPVERIASVKMGTTVATNALLERRGEPTVLFITRGFGDQLRIGYQNRPRIFDRAIRLPEPLYAKVVEVDERVGADGHVYVPLGQDALARALGAARAEGFRAVAIVFMHAFRYPEHERRAAELARAAGFEQVSASHEVSPLMKLVPRGDTTVLDAHLTPVLRRHLGRLASDLADGGERAPLFFMKSNGGLSDAATFRGKDSILSGPAGGIVGMARTSLEAGFTRVIGFDMGGTSTDVSHFAGTSMTDLERVFDSVVAGTRISAPMLAIHTIAAGGGSVLHFDGRRFRVGPDSAGANPGPACYRRGGPLALTDANVLLGRIQPESFPPVFGLHSNEPLDRDVVTAKFQALAEEVGRARGVDVTAEQVAQGFVQVAVANMANAIKHVSVSRGHDVTEYVLASFGGAAGQHACAIADELGMHRVFIHPLAGLLSAYGMGLVGITAMREEAFERPLADASVAEMNAVLNRLAGDASREMERQGVPSTAIRVVRRAHLRYDGTDTALVVVAANAGDMRREFERLYRQRFAFTMSEKQVVIEAVSVEATSAGETNARWTPRRAAGGARRGTGGKTVSVFLGGGFRDTPLHLRGDLPPGATIEGPAIIAEETTTTLIEIGWRATVGPEHELVLERYVPRGREVEAPAGVTPVLLEVFNGLFMSIAEQMGTTLAKTAHSVNIKERLDFSCALFDADGNLVANAPHVPVHLGSMGDSVNAIRRKNRGRIRPGDVFALNDPYEGGTHLPDVTVVLPVFGDDGRVLAHVAARGHHADIGGMTPGSMPPFSRTIDEEGVLIDNLKVVEGGVFREAAVRAVLSSGPHPARNPDQNVADLRAQIAACEEGRRELLRAIDRHGLATVQAYMQHVQDYAEECIRRAIVRLEDGEFECPMDSGARIHVRAKVNKDARSIVVDFGGTSPELSTNFNAPPAVVRAAVLYAFRTLVDEDIPMNAGCMKPITIVVPEGSMLSPRRPAATVAGNVETSQCITDALFGALSVMAASQGTMNNFTFGNRRHQYYETIAGGSGAGDGFPGTAAVQTHMTNSRLTDPEVLEWRFPVLVEEHSIRERSGGAGRYRGGDGALRRIRFLEPMTAAILSSRRVVAPHGLAGGGNGECGASWIERADGTREALRPCDVAEMEPGDVFVVSTPSGGGYGRDESQR